MKNNIPKQPPEMAYLDTNVISFYFDLRPEMKFMREATLQWWAKKSGRFFLCTSYAVKRELERGTYYHQRECLDMMAKIAVVPGNDEIDQIAQYYMDHYVVPKEDVKYFRGDAMHLAICAFHKIEYLLTWNLKHLANVNKMKHLKILNARMDLPTPIITTPAQLL